MLIKLDNGDYINTDKVALIYTEQCMDLAGKRGIHEEITVSVGASRTEITPTDRDRIVKAMGGKLESSGEILTDQHGVRYQVMTGRELIASLADDAMQDEPLHESYGGVEDIVPELTYRAYLDGGDSSLSGWWEEASK